MATTEDSTNVTTGRYFHPTACALDILINAAPKKAVSDAYNHLDGGNSASYLMRGLSYITALIADQDEIKHQQANACALGAVAELTELVSRLIEMGTEAEFNDAMLAQDEFKAFQGAVKKAQEVAA